jgi:hypothetical protein
MRLDTSWTVSRVSDHQRRIKEVIQKIEKRRDSYGSVLVKSAIMKQEGIWKNIVTKILPLHVSDVYTPPKRKLDYGKFAIFEDIISLNDLIEMVRGLPEKIGPEKVGSIITIGSYQVQVEGERLDDGYEYDSGVDYLDVGWCFERYHYRSPHPGFPSEPLVSPDLPLFPDCRTAIEMLLGIDLSRYSDLFGIVICLPNYGARIEKVNIGSREIKVKVQTKAEDIKNIVGKLYCQRGKEVKQEDMQFTNETGSITVGFKPDSFYLALISKVSGEILDTRRFYSGWELPKGIVIDIPEYEIRELIRHGETETVEFKEDVGKPEEFAETVVAFANTKGGIILIGIDDHANIVGLSGRDHEGIVTNILRSHCEPPVEYRIDKRQLDEKNILVLRAWEGKDKPYTVRDKGPYVRANATDRVATRYELDEFYRAKQSGYRPYY